MRTKTVSVMELRRGMVLYTRENGTRAKVKAVTRSSAEKVVTVDVVEMDRPLVGSQIDVMFPETAQVEVALMPGWIIRVEGLADTRRTEKYLEYDYCDGIRWGGQRWAAKRFICAEDAMICANRHRMHDEYHVFIEFEK